MIPLPVWHVCFTLAMLALFHLLPSWGLFPSFLPSVSPRVAEDYSTVIGMALDNNSLPALFFHMDDVSGRVGGCVFFGGLVSFLPSSCWMARWFVGAIPQPTVGHPVKPGLNARRDPVPLRGASVFFGRLGLFPLPPSLG